ATPEILSHHTRTAKHDAAHLTLPEDGSILTPNLDLVAGQRLTTQHEFAHIVALCRRGTTFSSQATQINSIDLYPAIEWRKADTERGFSHSIARHEGLFAKAAIAKAIRR